MVRHNGNVFITQPQLQQKHLVPGMKTRMRTRAYPFVPMLIYGMIFTEKQASARRESSYEAKQLRRPRIGNLFYYEILARLMSRTLSRKWLILWARDRWVVSILKPFSLLS